jgi:hypothetical protein
MLRLKSHRLQDEQIKRTLWQVQPFRHWPWLPFDFDRGLSVVVSKHKGREQEPWLRLIIGTPGRPGST